MSPSAPTFLAKSATTSPRKAASQPSPFLLNLVLITGTINNWLAGQPKPAQAKPGPLNAHSGRREPFLLDLLATDRALFVLVNQSGLHNQWTDAIAIVLSSRILWLLLYLAAGVYAWRQKDRALWWLLGTILITVGCSDAFSGYVLKPWFARARPCHELLGVILPTGKCGGFFGFPSNHAVNAGVVCGVLLIYRKHLKKNLLVCALALAASVAISRVWLGVHYPLDVTVGLLFGLAVGAGAAQAASKR
ncbi:MAG: phosphatase PAP2 family protein [Proteobacteria bacterium]|nr:phosphatase PAP2 family protein [Pseudomonadota bacterium]